MDAAVRILSHHSLAPSTHRTYQTGLRRFAQFCFAFNVSQPFPLSENVLCYFVAMLAYQGLAIQSIKTYVAAVKHENVASGNPDLVKTPHLRQAILQGAHRLQGSLQKSCPRARLPISLHLLRQLKVAWAGHLQEFKWCALWAATTLSFFGFFRSGEITIPTLVAFNSSIHLSWGDVAVDSIEWTALSHRHVPEST